MVVTSFGMIKAVAVLVTNGCGFEPRPLWLGRVPTLLVDTNF